VTPLRTVNNSRIYPSHAQRGVAIILAVLIVALAASAAAFAAWQQGLWIRQTENRVNQAQAMAVVRAAIDFGRAVLARDASNQASAAVDHLDEDWAKYSLAVPVEGGSVQGKITDQQSLYNINNLLTIDPNGEIFKRLLKSLDLKPELADYARDWVDQDDQPQFPGAEDLDYLNAKPEPYRAANQPIVDVDELYYVKGFDAEVMKKLRPFICALPIGGAPTSINVNTAPKEVLAAVFESASIGQQILEMREQNGPFKNENNWNTRTQSLFPDRPPGGGQPEQPGGEQPPSDNKGNNENGNGRPQTQQAPPSGEESNQQPGENPPAPPGQPGNPPRNRGGNQTGNTGQQPGQGNNQQGDPNQPPQPAQFGQQFDIKSNFFLIAARGEFGQVQQGYVALVQRAVQPGGGNAPLPSIVWEKQTLN
jgi:general secretion pathway protein K